MAGVITSEEIVNKEGHHCHHCHHRHHYKHHLATIAAIMIIVVTRWVANVTLQKVVFGNCRGRGNFHLNRQKKDAIYNCISRRMQNHMIIRVTSFYFS